MHFVGVWGAGICMILLVLHIAADVQRQRVLTLKSGCSKKITKCLKLKKATTTITTTTCVWLQAVSRHSPRGYFFSMCKNLLQLCNDCVFQLIKPERSEDRNYRCDHQGFRFVSGALMAWAKIRRLHV